MSGDGKRNHDVLRLEAIAFEVRYPFAYPLWDRAGELWARLARTRPKLRPTDATPARVAAVNEETELAVEAEKAYLIAHRPEPSIAKAKLEFDEFFQAIVATISPNSLTRVGVRLNYAMPRENIESAAAAVVATHRLHLPQHGSFGIRGAKVNGAEFSVTWRGEALGCTLGVKSEERRFEIRPPPGAYELKLETVVSHRLVASLDYYTVAAMTTAQLRPSVWAEQAIGAFRKQIEAYGLREGSEQ